MNLATFRREYLRLLLIGLLLSWVVYRLAHLVDQSHRPPVESTQALITRVIDGDTLLTAENQRIRLIGVDTPETKHPDRPEQPYGAEATEYTRSQVEGKYVRLVFDRIRFDRYERQLAFVFHNGQMLNEQLVERGLARAEPLYPFRTDYKNRLLAAEERARLRQLGIWSIETNSPAITAPPATFEDGQTRSEKISKM